MRLRPSPAARRPLLRPAALALALAAALATTAGCTSEPAPTPGPAGSESALGAAAASTPVAELQAGLTALLVERVYVVAAATEVLTSQPASRETQGALNAVEASSTALADLLGATYSEARDPLQDALRRQDALLARHAAALADGDPVAAGQAREELAEAQRELGRVLRRVVPTLDAQEVAERLDGDLRAQLAAGSYEELHETAVDAAANARLLAAGIAADRELGSSSTDAVRLRADLSGLLTEHVALTAALARELPGDGASASAALDRNAELLAEVLGEPYAAARGAFLRSWSGHLDRLERYAAIRADGSDGAAERGLMLGYPAELARLLAEHVRGLPAQTAQTELEPALAAQLAAIEQAAAGTPEAPAALRTATAEVLPAAAILSAAIAQDLRLS